MFLSLGSTGKIVVVTLSLVCEFSITIVTSSIQTKHIVMLLYYMLVSKSFPR